MVDKKELTQLLQDLVRLPSVNPPGNEALVANYVIDWAKREGLEVKLDQVMPGRPNVYLTLKGNEEGPRLLFNTHMDVVPEGSGWSHDPFGGEIVDNKLYGRGSADTKGSLAAMLLAAKAINNSNNELKGSLIIAAVCDEEGAGRGTVQSLKTGLRADFAIVGEPTSLRVVIAAKGSSTFEIMTLGKASHSSVPNEGVNAIYQMRRIVKELEDFSKQLASMHHPLLGHPTVSVDVIRGGSSPWIVPDSCRIILDRRTLPGETQEVVQQELNNLLRRVAKENPDGAYELKVHQTAQPAEIPANERIVRIALQETSVLTNKIINSPPSKAIVTVSSGNHGLAVAYACKELDRKAIVCLPKDANPDTIRAIQQYGAEVHLVGYSHEEAYREALRMRDETGAVMANPCEDPLVIAEQGTTGVEILRDKPDIDTILVPIGGGGLISGIAFAAKKINEKVKVVGIQPANAPSMAEAFRAGRSVPVQSRPTIADGLAVKEASETTLKIIQQFVDEIVLVSEEQMEEGILTLLKNDHVLIRGDFELSSL
jgi:acetylornithine deacetylase